MFVNISPNKKIFGRRLFYSAEDFFSSEIFTKILNFFSRIFLFGRRFFCSSSDLQSRYTEARKAATSAIKKSKEKSWEEFGRRLDSNYFSANKVFWQTIRRLRGKRSSITYSIKDSNGNILTDENEILSRWRE